VLLRLRLERLVLEAAAAEEEEEEAWREPMRVVL